MLLTSRLYYQFWDIILSVHAKAKTTKANGETNGPLMYGRVPLIPEQALGHPHGGVPNTRATRSIHLVHERIIEVGILTP